MAAILSTIALLTYIISVSCWWTELHGFVPGIIENIDHDTDLVVQSVISVDAAFLDPHLKRLHGPFGEKSTKNN